MALRPILILPDPRLRKAAEPVGAADAGLQFFKQLNDSGNFVPVESLPGWVASVGRFAFNYWANLGFSEVVARDHDLGAALGPVLVLASIAVTLFAVNVLLFMARARRGGLT